MKFSSNPWLVFSLILAAITQLFIIYSLEVSQFFGLHRLNFLAWIVLGGLAIWATFTGVIVSKWIEKWAGHVIEPSEVIPTLTYQHAY